MRWTTEIPIKQSTNGEKRNYEITQHTEATKRCGTTWAGEEPKPTDSSVAYFVAFTSIFQLFANPTQYFYSKPF
jgi:hypothetical protein